MALATVAAAAAVTISVVVAVINFPFARSPGRGLLTRLQILFDARDFCRLQFNYFAHIFGEHPIVSIAT